MREAERKIRQVSKFITNLLALKNCGDASTIINN
jgi:hypothetical protein